MRKTLAAALLLAAGLETVASPEDHDPPAPETLRNPWRGFAPGSWTIVGCRSLALPGAEPRDFYRDEVVGIDRGGAPLLQSARKSPLSGLYEHASEPFFFVPREFVTQGMAERSRRRETIVVAGRSLPCTAVESSPAEPDPRLEVHLTVWKADDVVVPPWDIVGLKGRQALPAGVVRATLTLRGRTRVTEVTAEIEDFHASIDVMGRTVECVVGRMGSVTKWEGGSPVLRSWKCWLSPEIPGGIARRDRQCTGAPGARLYDYTTRDEVTAFHAVR